jgi:hypothetical protein
MDCTQLETIFAGDREEDLSDAESTAFEAHLSDCSKCLERLAEAEDAVASLPEWSPPEPSEIQWAAVEAGIKVKIEPPPLKVGGSQLPMFLAMAAAFLLIAGLGFVLTTTPTPDGSRDNVGMIPPTDGGDGAAVHPASPGGAAEATDVQVFSGYEHTIEVYDDVLCVVIHETQ